MFELCCNEFPVPLAVESEMEELSSVSWKKPMRLYWRSSLCLHASGLLSSWHLHSSRSDRTGELLSYGETSPLDALMESLEKHLSVNENDSSDPRKTGSL